MSPACQWLKLCRLARFRNETICLWSVLVSQSFPWFTVWGCGVNNCGDNCRAASRVTSIALLPFFSLLLKAQLVGFEGVLRLLASRNDAVGETKVALVWKGGKWRTKRAVLTREDGASFSVISYSRSCAKKKGIYTDIMWDASITSRCLLLACALQI